MKCPVDDTTLAITERRGIEVDYCPQCRGVWLDRGELDKLIERAAEEFPEPRDRDDDRDRGRDRDYDRPPPPQGYPSQGYRGSHPPRGDYRKKKKSFLSDFFEFGD